MLTERQIIARIDDHCLTPPFGRVKGLGSNRIEADGPAGNLGGIFRIASADSVSILAEAVSVAGGRLVLTPMAPAGHVRLGDRVYATRHSDKTDVGDGYGGRCVDALGRPIDGLGSIEVEGRRTIDGALPTPMDRRSPNRPMHCGIKAIDGLLTLGVGQRVGIFAASGVGKTSLMEQMIDQADVDRVVICLVGERGREVESVWGRLSSRQDRRRFTVVAATSDDSPSARARAPLQTLALAEHWRDKGEHVLVMMDSITRLAMALRELGLSAGAPQTTRAYTPNVFAALPRMVERCGALRSGGAISAVMTVLAETDDVDDPIAETMKSLLDGHIILGRHLAEQGQFPAIDITRSVSRGIEQRVSKDHHALITDTVAMLSSWQDGRVMIETGAYRQGSNALLDRAIVRLPSIRTFLKQSQSHAVSAPDCLTQLREAVGQAS